MPVRPWPDVDFADPANPSLSYPFDLVDLFTELGEFEAAWKLVGKYFNDPTPLLWLRTRRTTNGIRLLCDPRMQGLVEKSGLPPSVHPVACN